MTEVEKIAAVVEGVLKSISEEDRKSLYKAKSMEVHGNEFVFKDKNGNVVYKEDTVLFGIIGLNDLGQKIIFEKDQLCYQEHNDLDDLNNAASTITSAIKCIKAIDKVSKYEDINDIDINHIADIVGPVSGIYGAYIGTVCYIGNEALQNGKKYISIHNAELLANMIECDKVLGDYDIENYREQLEKYAKGMGMSYEELVKYLRDRGLITDETLSDLLSDGMNEAANARVIVDPIVLDLNGNGVTKTTIKEGTYFDLNGDGFAEKTEWIENEDGLLIRDLNGNGKVDNAGELIGENQLLSNGKLSKNGLEVLQDLDTNKDGYLDKNDLAYSELLVWRDLNGNGRVDDKELSTLDELGIDKLKLYENLAEDATAGSGIKKDGTEFKISDEFFEVNRAASIDQNYIGGDYEDEINKLPQIFGTGNVTNLRDSMRKDEELKNLVSEFISNPNLLNSIELLDDILFQWCGVSEVDKNSRGNNIDARVLEVVEKFAGEIFTEPVSGSGDSSMGSLEVRVPANPNSAAALIIEECYNEIKNYVLLQLGLRSYLNDYLDLIKVKLNGITGEYFYDLSNLEEYAKNNVNKSEIALVFRQLSGLYKNTIEINDKLNIVVENLKADSSEFSVLYGIENVILDKSQSIYGDNTNNYIIGSSENDSIYGRNGNDYLVGGEGNDNIYGENGNDYLEGGKGNDYLEGGYGNDTYVYSKGDGNDTIYDYSSISGEVDKLILKDISKDEVTLRRESYKLKIIINETGETITINDYFYNSNYRIEEITFADNSVMKYDDVTEYFKTVGQKEIGTEGNDTIRANFDSINWVMKGEGGDDSIYGKAGDDYLEGGKGNDYLEGGYGNDTYVYSKGDGNDTIYDYSSISGEVDKLILNDINSSDVSLSKEGYNLVVSINGTEDKITINDHYYSSNYRLENIMFADGVNVSCDNTGSFDIDGAVAMLKQTYCLTSEDEAIINTSNINTETNTDDSSFVAFLNTNQQ